MSCTWAFLQAGPSPSPRYCSHAYKALCTLYEGQEGMSGRLPRRQLAWFSAKPGIIALAVLLIVLALLLNYPGSVCKI